MLFLLFAAAAIVVLYAQVTISNTLTLVLGFFLGLGPFLTEL